MPRTGRPTVPNEVKARRGTARKDRTPNHGNLAVVDAAPVSPDDYDPADAFRSVLESGRVWLAASDSLALAMLRESLEERAELRSVVVATQQPDARKALRDLDKQIIGQLSMLGFDPSSRARLGLAEVKAQSTLEKLRETRGR